VRYLPVFIESRGAQLLVRMIRNSGNRFSEKIMRKQAHDAEKRAAVFGNNHGPAKLIGAAARDRPQAFAIIIPNVLQVLTFSDSRRSGALPARSAVRYLCATEGRAMRDVRSVLR
jgi:hypothetical protein